MTEEEFEGMLEGALEQEFAENLPDDPNYAGARTSTFEAAGVLTNNRGLVVTLADGSEFQLTIVRSR